MAFIYDMLHVTLHAQKRWSAPTNFAFTLDSPVVPVYPAELRRLAFAIPIVLHKVGSSIQPVALIDNHWLMNDCMDAEGTWLAEACPQVLSMHPFRLAFDHTKNTSGLMVARDVQIVNPEADFAFFNADSEQSAEVRAVIRRFQILNQGTDMLRAAAQRLFASGFVLPLAMPAIPSVRAPRGTFYILDAERFLSDGKSLLETSPKERGIMVRLAGAMLISQRRLARGIRQQAMIESPAFGVSQGLPLDALHTIQTTATAAEDSDDSALLPTSGHEFLIDDDAVMTFDFTATGSVFHSG